MCTYHSAERQLGLACWLKFHISGTTSDISLLYFLVSFVLIGTWLDKFLELFMTVGQNEIHIQQPGSTKK